MNDKPETKPENRYETKEDRREKAEKAKDALRITQQFRARHGMVYDFRCRGARLTVRIFPRESAADANEWRVEALTSEAPEAIVVSEWGPTRAEALALVGRSWAEKAEAHALPLFDWSQVAEALLAVRAI